MSERPRISFRRKLAFQAIILIVLVALIELSSLVALRFLEGGWTSRKAFLAALEPLDSAAGGDDGAQAVTPPRMTDFHAPSWILHPYLGFVRNPDAPQQRVNGKLVRAKVNEHGFFGASPLAEWPDDHYVVLLTGGSVALELFLYGGQALADEL
jgi:hypothetical protein